MTTLTVEIDKERDLPVLKALLSRMDLRFRVDDDEWANLSEAEIESIKSGLEDLDAGRVHSHVDVTAHIDKKLNR
jgi:predicted transcriptional regulator